MGREIRIIEVDTTFQVPTVEPITVVTELDISLPEESEVDAGRTDD
ncbi:MAG: hypothetical protein WBM90_11575 [Acidimicrobiia bacterium]